jgi:hypothetical protein
MIESGSSCAITQDIVIGGKVAFRTGERVTVEQVVPNVQMPDNKYVVFSIILRQRFQLKAENLYEMISEPPAFAPIPPLPARGPKKTVSPSGKAGPPTDTKKVLIIVGLCLVAMISVIVVIASIGNSSKESGNNPETAPTVATTATPAVQKTWQTVSTLSGSSDRRSESFTLTGGDQKLVYTVKVTNTEMPECACAIYVMAKGTSLASDGGVPEVMVDKAGSSDTRLAKDPGDYYLDISAANCQWTVSVQELR